MKVQPITLKFEEDKNEFVFDRQFNVIDDKKLVKTLSRENIKNEGSSLIIKSMNNLPISDVIQLKINVAETGTFLVSFDKEKIDEKAREKLLADISALKDKIEITKDSQVNKIKKLLVILDRFNPIYATYKSANDVVILNEDDFNNLIKDTPYAYPLILLKKEEKVQKVKQPKPEKDGKERRKIEIDFPLFNFDYLFNALFVLLFGFGVVVGIYEILNKESIAAFLLVLAVVFLFVSYYSVFSTLYKRNQEKYKGLKYWLLIYLGVGAIIGLALGYIICKFALKTENTIDYSLILKISIPSVIVLSLVGIYASKLINLIMSKIKK